MLEQPQKTLEMGLDAVPAPIRDRVLIFRLFILIGGWLRALMDRRLEAAGITTQQAALISVTEAADRPLTQNEIAAYLGVSHQNVRQLANALTRKGLLEVRVDPQDRRIRRMVPTRPARDLFAQRNADDYRTVAKWFSVFDDGEAGTLLDLLLRLAKQLAEERAAGGGHRSFDKRPRPRRSKASREHGLREGMARAPAPPRRKR